MLIDIASNLIADLIFATLLVTVGWLLFVVTRRSRLFKFFGIGHGRRIFIYLSHLRVAAGGALDPHGTARSYQGSVVAFGEMSVSNAYRDLFTYPLPALFDKPGVLRSLFVADVEVQIQQSPLSAQEMDSVASIVTLGSPGYNVVSGYVETVLHSEATFDLTTTGAIKVSGLSPITDTAYGFVERVVDRANNRPVFYAAGLSELGTVGAAYYLAIHWPRLWRKYKSKDNFLVMLKIDARDPTLATVIFEK